MLIPAPGSLLLGGPLSIEAVPAGATVVLDGKVLGKAPLSIPSVTAGIHHLRLTAENHFDWDGDLTVAPGSPVARHIELRAKPGEIEINSVVKGAQVWVDGQLLGAAPLFAQSEPGLRTLRVEAEGYAAWEQKLTLGPNEHRAVYVVANGSSLALAYGDPSDGIAVMIDNKDDARPQTGLNNADVVYEALAEGGITRYMALFLTHAADVVGPVRSARHYFVNWANEYRAPLMHIGASPQGYNALAATRLPTVDGRGFYRTSRPAPHNAYTSTATVKSALGRRDAATFGGLHFGDPVPTEVEAGQLRVPYGRGYSVSWTFDNSTGLYERSINGRPLNDAVSGERVTATNVLVMWMDSWLLPDDDAARLDFRQTGGGQLLALTRGFATDARWSRSSLRAVTEYRDQEGQNLLLTPGNTWIQVIPIGTRVDLFGDGAVPIGGTD